MNETIKLMMQHRSIRAYSEQVPSDEMIETMVKAGMQAAFAGQLGSVIVSKDRAKNPFAAPLYFIVCVDLHRMEQVMQQRGWELKSTDSAMLLFGMQDASYLAQNLVLAAESLGLGTCYLGFVPFQAEANLKRFDLPPRVFPMVGISVGYPAENPPTRPRYPLEFACFPEKYPRFSAEQIKDASQQMDEGYLAQNYYKDGKLMIQLEQKTETYDATNYSWTEHISRKWGQWLDDEAELKEIMQKYGFYKD
ncbi:MAG: nitroreductase family protein [Candidatus Cloacimonadales bacterium]